MAISRKKKSDADFRRNALRSPRNDGPDLAELQERDFRAYQETREEAANEAKTEKKDSGDDGNKSGSK